jgi:hypothetical protein
MGANKRKLIGLTAAADTHIGHILYYSNYRILAVIVVTLNGTHLIADVSVSTVCG